MVRKYASHTTIEMLNTPSYTSVLCFHLALHDHGAFISHLNEMTINDHPLMLLR